MTRGLSTLGIGDTGKVKEIKAGKEATKRLYEMGLNTGATLKVVKNDRGPIIICLAGNKVALGRGLANKIMLQI